jgi:hypothetical protein
VPGPPDEQPRSGGGSPPAERSGGASPSRGNPPIGWIALAAILALAAIGLGIWAFTTRSDLDDAEATIERQRRQIASEEQRAVRREEALRRVGRREERAYRRVRRRLIGERARAADLMRRVEREAGQLTQARQEVASAQSTTERRNAQLREARQERDLAAACTREALDSIGRFFEAASARAGRGGLSRCSSTSGRGARPWCAESARSAVK